MANKPNRKRIERRARQQREAEVQKDLLVAQEFNQRVAIRKEYYVSAPFDIVSAAMLKPEYIALMRLCKLMNSLTVMHLLISNNVNNSETSHRNSTLQSGFLFLTGTLCESLNRIRLLRTDFEQAYKGFESYQSLVSLLDDPLYLQSYEYLRRVRNKVAFHADPVPFEMNNSILKDMEVVFEHNTGYNRLYSHYLAADFVATVAVYRTADGVDDIPTDESLLAFQDRWKTGVPVYPKSPDDTDIEDSMRRAFCTVSQLSQVVIPEVHRFSLKVHHAMGATVKPGKPPALIPQ